MSTHLHKCGIRSAGAFVGFKTQKARRGNIPGKGASEGADVYPPKREESPGRRGKSCKEEAI